MASDKAIPACDRCGLLRQCRLQIRSACMQIGLCKLRGLLGFFVFVSLVFCGVYVVHYVLESRDPTPQQLGPPLRFLQQPHRAGPLPAPGRRDPGRRQRPVYDVYKPDPDRAEYDYPGAEDAPGKKKQKDQSPVEAKEPVSHPLYLEPDQALNREFWSMSRLVHLDLKGAPPSVDYLERVLPLLKQAGATGLLVEYEDSFPYSGNLSLLAAKTAYTAGDVARLGRLARQNEMEVIPLVPTFGHMEFVLKHSEFVQLRETASNPQAITPAREESYNLIRAMIAQVVAAHPESSFLHIGCDEVYELGNGQAAQLMVKSRLTKEDVFLQHVSRVAAMVRDDFPRLKAIMWDDHLRKIPLAKLQKAGLSGLVEPMVWAYVPDISVRVPPSVWKTYGRVFSHVWVASAFKGASGVVQYITDATYHLQNHYSWIRTIQEHSLLRHEVKVRGMAITGWSRYDHFAAPCELLPVALPSLMSCLSAFRNGGFSSELHALISKILSCSSLVELGLPRVRDREAVISQDCGFPGSDLFYSVRQLWGVLHKYESDVGLQERIRGWLTGAHVRQEFSSPGQMKVLGGKLSRTIDRLRSLRGPLKASIQRYYDRVTTDEWLELNVDQRVDDLKELLKKCRRLLSRRTWGERTAGKTTPAPRPDLSREPQGQQKQDQMPRAGAGDVPALKSKEPALLPAAGRQQAAPGVPQPVNQVGAQPVNQVGAQPGINSVQSANIDLNKKLALAGRQAGFVNNQAPNAAVGVRAVHVGKALGIPGLQKGGQGGPPGGRGGLGKAQAGGGRILEKRAPKGGKHGGKNVRGQGNIPAKARTGSKKRVFGPMGSQKVTPRPQVRGQLRLGA